MSGRRSRKREVRGSLGEGGSMRRGRKGRRCGGGTRG